MLKMKKAQIPEALILVAVIILTGYGLYSVYAFQANYSNQVSIPKELYGAYEGADKFEVFAKDAAKLSVQEAFSEISSLIECPYNNESVQIWGSCISNDKVNTNFAKEIDSKFRTMLNSDRKYKLSITSSINFEFESQTVNLSGNGYNGTYSYSTKFSVGNPMKEDLESIYGKLLSRKASCIELGSDMGECMGQMNLGDWTLGCISPNQDAICLMKTKQNYFFNDSFSRIEMRLAL